MPRVPRLRGLIVLAVVGSVATAAASEAGAQGDVIVDPDSPAGTEYVIPHEAARRGASPDVTAGAGERSAREPASPAFGAGVGASAKPTDQGTDKGNSAEEAGEVGGFTGGDATRAVAALRDPADGGVPVGLITAGAGLSVLILAGAVLLASRRARRDP
jgi:hypothetical protein